MIKTRDELKKYLDVETGSLRKKKSIRYFGWLPMLNCLGESFGIYKLLVYLRKCEYYSYRGGLLKYIYILKLKGIENRFSIRIPINVFDIGLQIPHLGPIVVHPNVRIGKNCRIHVGVNIGAEKDETPMIGNDCYIGPGAKVFGGISIGDRCKIGANAVVNRSFKDDQVIVGVPGRSVEKTLSQEKE